ncbi:MAG TPA: 3'-5' exonuclease [Terrimesophilobacter sp.]|nr:3'-5' exonuclease [Terrimesophilobacter sp.]
MTDTPDASVSPTVDRAPRPESWVSVDVETSGPSPSLHSILSIGAVLLDEPDREFYIELKPTTDAYTESAMVVSGLSHERLTETGVDPREAMERFEQWLKAAVPAGNVPVFAGFNAPFDWMFVADWFERFLGRNPFGHSAIDIKSYYLGFAAETWFETSMAKVSPLYLGGRDLSHNALEDAKDQAELFRHMIADSLARRRASMPE